MEMEERYCNRKDCKNSFIISKNHKQEHCSEGCRIAVGRMFENELPFYTLKKSENDEGDACELLNHDGLVRLGEEND